MKRCPFCAEEIQDRAVKCRHCGERLDGRSPDEDDIDRHPTIPNAGRPTRYDTLDAAVTEQKGPTILGAQYRILKKLGKGGMGVVYLAEDTEMGDRLVAIKVLPPELADNVRAVENLRREAMTAINLTHPNIIRLYGFHSDGDMKYLVMEYVDGQTLEQKLTQSQDGKLSFEEMLTIVEKVAAALDYAHSRRQPVFHRDLKPSNIMIGKDGEVRLMDFGIAREMKDSYTSVTGKQDTSGTLPYMSPEQARGKRPTAAMDIYSLGVVCYECLNGRPPFCTGELTYQILHETPEPLNEVADHVNQAVQQALAKDPGGRPDTAEQLIGLLRRERSEGTRQQAASRSDASIVSPVEVRKTSARLALPADLIEVPDASYVPLEGLATGSREAQDRQRQALTDLGLPLEVRTAKVGIVFRLIPAGSFTMGSAPDEKGRSDGETQHEVTLTKPFYCGKSPVTQGQWQQVMGSNPSYFKEVGGKGPVENLEWIDCQRFLKKLCRIESVPECTYRLLTESQWEYMCRAGTDTCFHFGNDPSALGAYAWYRDNSRGTTHPVGQKDPNGFGLYDTYGNVYEWCLDCWEHYPSGPVVDPNGPSSGCRIYRSGCWGSGSEASRSSYRGCYLPGGRVAGLGLRLARTIPS